MQLKLESGHLKVSPAVFKFAKGQLDMDLSLNTKTKPEINFKAFGKNIDLWVAVNDSQAKDHFMADVNIDTELHAQGRSQHELVSSMNGELYVTIENAKIRHEYMDLLFVDLVGWTTRKATDSQFYDFNCGVMDFSLENGVISTKGLILDTNSIVITVTGKLTCPKNNLTMSLFLKRRVVLFSRQSQSS